MKHIIKLFSAIFLFCLFSQVFSAGVFDIGGVDKVVLSSMEIADGGGDLGAGLEGLAISILGTFKVVLSAIIILFLVYAGAGMVLAMGSDEEKITSGKNQLWYAAVGLLFINIPGTLYDVFYSGGGEVNEVNMTNQDFNEEINGGSLLLNEGTFQNVFYNGIVPFMQITIFGVALFVMVLAGYQILMARGKDEAVTEARTKILYSIVALFFVGFIEGLKRVVYVADLGEATNLFSSISNLILLFAVPVAVFFLYLAAFYYITAAGDEEKVKKSKNIVINTFLATLLIMAIYTFLLDLIQI